MTKLDEVDQRTHRERWQNFVRQNFFQIGLMIAVVWSQIWPRPGDMLNNLELGGNHVIVMSIIFMIFIFSGLTLEIREINTPTALRGAVIGLISILVITATIGFVAIKVPFGCQELSIGLALFCILPSSPATGLAIVHQAGGSEALAVLLSATTNILSVVTMPFFVRAILGMNGIHIDIAHVFLELLTTLLVPLACGKLVREIFPRCQDWIEKYGMRLKLTRTLMVVIAVWLILSSAQKDLATMSPAQIGSVAAVHAVVHVVFLCINYSLSSFFGLKHCVFKTVVILASQKNVAAGIALVSSLDGIGNEGLIDIPFMIGILPQFFISVYLASLWGSQDDKENFPPPVMVMEAGADRFDEAQTKTLAPEAADVGEEVVLSGQQHETDALQRCEDKVESYGGV